MAGEIFAGLGAFKTMYDMAKALNEINDATIRNGAVIKLQEKILAAREAQTTLLERVGELETEVASLKAWDTDKQRYKLSELRTGVMAYTLKEGMENGEPPHRLCANCYQSQFDYPYNVEGGGRGSTLWPPKRKTRERYFRCGRKSRPCLSDIGIF